MSDFIASFQQNFIDESRYLYLLQGLGTTLLITAFAAIIGIILGFLVAVIRSTYDQTGKMKFLNAICNIYLTVIRGTPTMVQLLIMYYVIFASSNLNKVVVAFLAFGINSGAYVAEIVRSGIMSIDRGQLEAGRSLGFSYASTMCIGNLRSGTDALSVFVRTGNKTSLKKAGYYFGIILFFAIGAGIGGNLSMLFGIHTIWISSALLSISVLLMFAEKLKI